jgi:predicted DNA-binding ArsR family transcriptional regulator
MYKEIAIDPACMADYSYYILLKREFGFDKGRYLAADIKAWARAAFQFAKGSDISPNKKKSVTNFLNKVQRGKVSNTFLLVKDREAIKEPSWEEWWATQSAHRNFSASLSESGIARCINHDAVLDRCDEWEIPPSISVKRDSAVGIVAAIEPLLYLSKEITIVDQYFRLTDNETLIELFKVLEHCYATKLTVVTSMGNPNIKASYLRDLQTLNTRSISFNWIKAPNKYFHDRYLLTDIGALKAGHGFMTEIKKGIHSDMLNINFVSQDEAQRTHQEINNSIQSGAMVVSLVE